MVRFIELPNEIIEYIIRLLLLRRGQILGSPSGGIYSLKSLSSVCKLTNHIINNSKYIHKHIDYVNKKERFGKVDCSWKKYIYRLKDIYKGNILKSIRINFEMKNLYRLEINEQCIDTVDIFLNCINLEKVVFKKCKIMYIKNINNADRLKTLNLFDSDIEKIDNLPNNIENLDLRYTICDLVLPHNVKFKKLKTNNCITSINLLNSMEINYKELIKISVTEGYFRRFIHIDTDTLKFNTCLKNVSIDSYSMENKHIKILDTGTGCEKRKLKKLSLANTEIDSMEELKLYVSEIEKLYMKNNINTCFNFTEVYSNSLKKILIYSSMNYSTSFFRNLNNIEEVRIRGGPIDIDLNDFINPEKIKKLFLYVFNIKNTNNLINFKNLKNLYIDTMYIENRRDSFAADRSAAGLGEAEGGDSRGSAVGDREAASTFGSDFGQVISKCDKLKSLGLNIRGSDSCISEYDVRKICSIPSLKKLDLRCIECHNISFIPDNIELCCLYKYKKGSDPLSSSGNCNISFM